MKIQGTKHVKEAKGVLRHSTRNSGRFSYEALLPIAADEQSVRATLDGGVLTVTLPKSYDVRTKRVKIS